jgi:aspartate aminotransferase/aminotransferase
MLTMDHWIAQRMHSFDSSGIRKMFELAARLKDPINLSIGEPDFPVPEPVKQALVEAIEHDKNTYAPTEGIPQLRQRLQAQIDERFQHGDRKVVVTSGTSGALVLAAMVMINPGDEVILLDPYFVMYDALIPLMGGVVRPVPTYPAFQPDVDRVADAITPRTKMIIVNSPCNPTGACLAPETMRDLALLAQQRGVCLVSDEIYHDFAYDQSHVTPADYNPESLVIDGFSKSYAMTGLRLGFAHGPAELIDEMIKLQQFTYVCAPHPVQYAGLRALDVSVGDRVADYRRKRDLLVSHLSPRFELVTPGGAFFAFAKAPWGTGEEFVTRAIENNVLVIPGKVFSRRDTHFRLSYAVQDQRLLQGIEILNRLAD